LDTSIIIHDYANLCSKALFASWVLEGRGREGKAYGEVNPCLGVLKKIGKSFEGF